MTHTSTEQRKLLLCPFCGGRARFEIDDEGWEWVECSGCGIQGNRSASLMEDCKPQMTEAWNRRAEESQARVPLDVSTIAEIAESFEAVDPTSSFWVEVCRAFERASVVGITQEKP